MPNLRHLKENSMKIRNGFVSNSSSSSFILTFSKPVETFEDLCEELNVKNIPGWDEKDDKNLKKVFEDILNPYRNMDVEEFYYNISDFFDDEYPFMEKSCRELYEEIKDKKFKVSYGDEYNYKMEQWMWILTKVINDEDKIRGQSER